MDINNLHYKICEFIKYNHAIFLENNIKNFTLFFISIVIYGVVSFQNVSRTQ